MAADHVRRMGRAEASLWRATAPQRRRAPFLSYPLREYLEELALAAAIVDPSNPHEGMRLIWRGATSMYLETPFGRSLVRLLKPNPVRYLRWLAEHREHFCNYGRWTVIAEVEGHAIIDMRDEYIWLESAHRGGAEGLLAACGVRGTVEAELSSPYSGRLQLRWQPHRS